MNGFNKALTALGLVVFLGAVAVLGGGAFGGKPVVFDGTDPRGGTVDLLDHRGKVILVQFFATWCPPCMMEFPGVQRAHARYADDGFVVVAVSLDRSESALTQFLQDRDVAFPVIFREGSSIAQRFNVRSIPRGMLLGRDGRVIRDNVRGHELESAILKAL